MFANERIESAGSYPLDQYPDPVRWARWRRHLTRQEAAVYLFLRWWFAREQDGPGITAKDVGLALGASDARPEWESRGRLSASAVVKAIRGLQEKGLVETDVDWDEYE